MVQGETQPTEHYNYPSGNVKPIVWANSLHLCGDICHIITQRHLTQPNPEPLSWQMLGGIWLTWLTIRYTFSSSPPCIQVCFLCSIPLCSFYLFLHHKFINEYYGSQWYAGPYVISFLVLPTLGNVSRRLEIDSRQFLIVLSRIPRPQFTWDMDHAVNWLTPFYYQPFATCQFIY
jgi:hypothetical protein